MIELLESKTEEEVAKYTEHKRIRDEKETKHKYWQNVFADQGKLPVS